MTYIGIIGGSGLYSIMETRKTMDVDTPYGKPSAPLEIGEINGVEVAFFAKAREKAYSTPSHG